MKLKELPVTAFRLLTVSVEVCPTRREAGLNAQLAGPLPEQARLMLPVNPDGLEAERLNFVESVPRITTAELLLG